MIKMFHEAPISIFSKVQEITDGDYALVHLFEESEEYLNLYKQAVEDGREVILDNSIFEKGEAFEESEFAKWVEELQPTYYIIPDALEDKDKTISNFDSWMEKYSQLPGKTMAVAQGKTYEEMVECYEYLVDKVDKICISFDYSFFNDWLTHVQLPTKYHEWSFGRQILLSKMLSDGIIRTHKPHHLLGAGLPQEFVAYRNYSWIDSLDTSNPVVHGVMGVDYKDYGLEDKESIKLFEMINHPCSADIWERVEDNIKQFKGMIYE